MLIRPVKPDDLEQLVKLAEKTGPGMTSLPADAKLLENKIKESYNSFSIDPVKPGNEAYRFILEDTSEKKIIGVSAIRARIGGYEPFYSYEIKQARHQSEALKVDKSINYLELKKEHDGPSIIGSLFLDPEYRKKKIGKLLSLSRFLFIADYPGRFADTVIAEMRGVINPKGKSPFWEGTVRHFFDMEYSQADYLSAKNKGFIADLMPKFPIYIPLLPDEVQACIGQVHQDTKPAMNFLEKIGFEPDSHVDIFDAGPRITAKVQDIVVVKNSKTLKSQSQTKSPEGKLALVSNMKVDYRCIQTQVKVDSDAVLLSKEALEALDLQDEDQVRVYEFIH